MDNVIFKDKIELSPIFPDFTNITSSTAFMEDNASLYFTIDETYTTEPILSDTSSNAILVVGVNQQTQKRYVEEFHSGSIYGTNWEEGYYKVYVRQFKKPLIDLTTLNGIESNDFFEMTKKELYWNKSILSFMVYLQPGTYVMGSPINELGRNPDEVQHKVTLTDGFYIGRTVLTNEMFDKVMDGIKPDDDLASITVNGTSKSTCFSLSNTYWDWYKETDKTNNYGRTYISYNKYQSNTSSRAAEYTGFGLCTLNNKTTYYPYPYLFNNNLPAGETDNSFISVINSVLPIDSYSWDIPTEAQWEYACRADSKSSFNNGENLKVRNVVETPTRYAIEPQINEVCWYKMHDGQRHECAMLKCNNWGLFDMHGNNWEWTKDFDSNEPVSDQPVIDPYNNIFISGSLPDIYGIYSDGKIIRGGWAGWSSRACRSAYRYKDYISSATPSYGVRLILRKSTIPITISPTDVYTCGDTTITSNECNYSLSRPLINNTDTVNLTYSINNTNNTITISNATITYNGSENYQYDVTIGPNATIHRTTPTSYTPVLKPVYNGPAICKGSNGYTPQASDFSCEMSGLYPGDTVYNVTYTITNNEDNVTAVVNTYSISTPSDCYVYTTADKQTTTINKIDCQAVLPVTLCPVDITPCVENTYPVVNYNDYGYEVSEGFLYHTDYVVQNSVVYSEIATGSKYIITAAEIHSASNDYRYELSFGCEANLNRIQNKHLSLNLKPIVTLKDPNNPVLRTDTNDQIRSKINIELNANGLVNDGTKFDYVKNVTYNVVNHTTYYGVSVSSGVPVKISNWYNGCYTYSQIGYLTTEIDIPQNPEYINLKLYPKDINVCAGYTVTTDDDIELVKEGLADGDSVSVTYTINNSTNLIIISSYTITKQDPNANYDYNVSTVPGKINRNDKDQISLIIEPTCNGFITQDETDLEIINHIGYNILNNATFNPNDTLHLTYSISKDANDIATITIDDWSVDYETNSCRTYSVSTKPLTLYPINVTGTSNNLCQGTTATLSNTSIDTIITGLQQNDGISNIQYTDLGNEVIIPDLSDISISKGGTGNYCYYFASSSVTITKVSPYDVPVTVTPNCTVQSGKTIYTTDSIDTIKGKLNYNCNISVVKQNNNDTVTVTNPTLSTTYNVTKDSNNNVVIKMASDFVLNTTTHGCYNYVKTVEQDEIQQNITATIPISVKVVADAVTYESGHAPTSFSYKVYMKYNNATEYTLISENEELTAGSSGTTYPINIQYQIANINNSVVNGDVINISSIVISGNSVVVGTVTVTKNGDNTVAREYTCEKENGTVTVQTITNKTLRIEGTVDDICYVEGSMTPEELTNSMNNSVDNRVMEYYVDNIKISDISPFNITYNSPTAN